MAKNISLIGANYPDVPAVQLPQTGGGTATFYDIQVIDNLTSTSKTDALSAKQGKVLNDKIEIETVTGISFTPSANISNVTPTIIRKGHVINVKIAFTFGGTANTEVSLGTIAGVFGAITGTIINRSNSKNVGGFQFTAGASGSSTIYANMS